jgi:hypothetical protein
MSNTDYKFEGWGAFGPDSIEGKFKWFEYEPKEFADDDLDGECEPVVGAHSPFPSSFPALPLYPG